MGRWLKPKPSSNPQNFIIHSSERPKASKGSKYLVWIWREMMLNTSRIFLFDGNMQP